MSSLAGAISPASFEHEHDDEHEHLVADFGESLSRTLRRVVPLW